MKKIIIFIISIMYTINISMADTFSNPYNDYVAELNFPGVHGYNYGGGGEIVMFAKEILARAIQYLPMLVLVLLLLACIKIIFDGDGKAGLKRIKYILLGVALMILSVYILNILSTIFFGHPVLNINFHRWY